MQVADHGMCCTRPCRQPTDGVRRKVSAPGKFSQSSADCQVELPLESAPLAHQLVEATSAAPGDPLPDFAVLSGSLFWPNVRSQKLTQRFLRRLHERPKRVSLGNAVYASLLPL